jgi:hypothetical protein
MLARRGAPVVALLLLVALATPARAWTVDPVGGSAVVAALLVGDAEGDGSREVVASTWDGTFRYSWDGQAWVEEHLGGSGGLAVALGDADRDGHVEVYAAEAGGELVRYEPAPGGGWVRDVVASFGLPNDVTTLTAGDLEGDGLPEVLAAVDDGEGRVVKVFHKHGAWQVVTLAKVGARVPASALGDADRDGRPEIVLGTDTGKVLELDPDEGWSKRIVGTFGPADWVQGVVVGDADHDGLAEVYAGGDDGGVVRFGWTGSGYNRWRIAQHGAGLTDLALADHDRDNRRDLFTTAWDGSFLRVAREPQGWISQTLAQVEGGSLVAVAVGDATHDGQAEAFLGTFFDGQHPSGDVRVATP